MNSSARQFLIFFALAFSLIMVPDFLYAGTPDYQWLTSINVASPKAVALDNAENIYVANAGQNRVLFFDNKGLGMGELTGLAKPISVAVDQDGRIYVGNDDRNNVEVYGSNGSGYSLLYELGSGNGEFIQPNGIALDGQGNIYVVDYKADLVKVYNPDGTAWFSFGGTGNTDGLFNSPTAIAIDKIAGKIIVTDQQKFIKTAYYGPQKGARVQVFDMNGIHLLSFGKFSQDVPVYGGSPLDEDVLTKPQGVAVDRDGNIFVADSHQHVVQAYDNTGVFFQTIYNLENPLRTPMAITVSLLTDKIYIASLTSSKIDIYERIPSYTVNVSSGSGGAVSPAGTLTIKRDEIIDFTVTPDPGYRISQVLVDDSPQDLSLPITLTVVADHVVEAVFEPDTFTVSATAGAGGSVDPAGDSQVTADGSLTIALTPNANYHLAELVVDDSSIDGAEGMTEYTFNNVWEAHTLEAQFAIDTFTIGSIAGDTDYVSVPNGGIVAYGGSLIVTILPKDGFWLKDVLVDGISIGPVTSYTFDNIDADHTVVPVFEEILYTVTAISAEGGEVSPAGATVVKQGASLDYTITPAQGFILIDVLRDGISIGPVTAHTFYDIDTDHTIAPVFAESRLFEWFETGDLSKLPWRTGGGSGWQVLDLATFVQENLTAWQAQNLAISVDNFIAQPPDAPASFLEVPLVVTEEGNIGFWFALSGDENTLRFLIDGAEKAYWTGGWEWSEVSFAVTPGRHIFRWEYTDSSGNDTAWLDDISLPPYADPLHPMLDLKVNNSDGPVIAGKRDELTLTVMALYGEDWQPPAGSQWLITRINANAADDDDSSDDNEITDKKLVKFSWQVPDGHTHIKVLDIRKMSKGTFYFVFGLYEEGYALPTYYDTVEVHVEGKEKKRGKGKK